MELLTIHTLLILLEQANANHTGCCTVLVHVHPGLDVLSYRRDAKYEAEIIIERTRWANREALKEYKSQGGYFCHTVITQDGWIITIGGRDVPSVNKKLEELGERIVSKGRVEKVDIETAEELLKEAGWGHFVVKSPKDVVGVASYDYRISSGRTELFRMKDGEYVKVTNNPNYYARGRFKEFDHDPVTAAIKIAGEDTYGIHRRDVITYELNVGRSTNVRVWVSYDGGALIGGAPGGPDPVRFLGRKIPAKDIPKIPEKKPLGVVTLRAPTKNHNEGNTTTQIAWRALTFGAIFGAIFGLSYPYLRRRLAGRNLY